MILTEAPHTALENGKNAWITAQGQHNHASSLPKKFALANSNLGANSAENKTIKERRLISGRATSQ